MLKLFCDYKLVFRTNKLAFRWNELVFCKKKTKKKKLEFCANKLVFLSNIIMINVMSGAPHETAAPKRDLSRITAHVLYIIQSKHPLVATEFCQALRNIAFYLAEKSSSLQTRLHLAEKLPADCLPLIASVNSHSSTKVLCHPKWLFHTSLHKWLFFFDHLFSLWGVREPPAPGQSTFSSSVPCKPISHPRNNKYSFHNRSAKSKQKHQSHIKHCTLLNATLSSSLRKCPTPGCDGSGHVTGRFTAHHCISGCPLAERNQGRLKADLSDSECKRNLFFGQRNKKNHYRGRLVCVRV